MVLQEVFNKFCYFRLLYLVEELEEEIVLEDDVELILSKVDEEFVVSVQFRCFKVLFSICFFFVDFFFVFVWNVFCF